MAKRTGRKPNVLKVILKVLSILVALIIILIPLAAAAVMFLNTSVNSYTQVFPSESGAIQIADDGGVLIDVRRGETSQSVGLRLERAGLISSRYIWNLFCRLKNEHVKTGTYRLELPATILSIHSLLVSGREVLHKVTIPEGVTLVRMAELAEEAGICSASDFLAASRDTEIINFYSIPGESLEGYLFPDTYFFPGSYPAEKTVMAMTDNFFKQLEIISPASAEMSMKEINDRVILASIVEREYRVAEEAPVMAGVFNNRLRINMALQSCATVVYIITEIQHKPHPSVVLLTDLEIRSPYNTYIHPGLPPGPICAPGFVALNAVMNPDKTEYLYFRLTDPASGRHYFSRTHDEHIKAGQFIPKGL